MNIVATQYNLQNKTLEIYLSGCYGNCFNCHNPELKDFKLGNYYKFELPNILQKIKEFDCLIDDIWILGGEPLDNNLSELGDLLDNLKTVCNDIWLWTRNDINKIPMNIKNKCKYIKTGAYIEKLKTDDNIQYGVKLASSNQKIYKIEGGDLI